MTDGSTITAEQLRGARAMLRWEQRHLAEVSGVALPTLKRMEGGRGPVRGTYENVSRVTSALEAAGVEFVDGDTPGVRLRKRED